MEAKAFLKGLGKSVFHSIRMADKMLTAVKEHRTNEFYQFYPLINMILEYRFIAEFGNRSVETRSRCFKIYVPPLYL